MVSQNKTFSIRIERQAKDIFPKDVERTEDDLLNADDIYFEQMNDKT